MGARRLPVLTEERLLTRTVLARLYGWLRVDYKGLRNSTEALLSQHGKPRSSLDRLYCSSRFLQTELHHIYVAIKIPHRGAWCGFGKLD